MYASVRVYAGNTGLADALVENAGEVRRIISEIEGFHAYFLLRSAEGTTSVSVYDTEVGAAESNRVAAEWLAENLPGVVTSPPQISAGEVVLHL